MALFVGDSFVIVLCCAIGVLHIRFYTSFWRRWKRCLRQSEYPPSNKSCVSCLFRLEFIACIKRPRSCLLHAHEARDWLSRREPLDSR